MHLASSLSNDGLYRAVSMSVWFCERQLGCLFFCACVRVLIVRDVTSECAIYPTPPLPEKPLPPGYFYKGIHAPRVLAQSYTRTPGILPRECRTQRSFGYGYGRLTYLTEGFSYRAHISLGYGIPFLQNPHKFRVRVCFSTQLTEFSGTGMNLLHNSQNFPVRVWTPYRTHRSVGYGC